MKREGNTLCLFSEDDKRYIPVKNVSNIYVFSEVEFNKRLLEFLTKNKIVLHLFNYYGYYIGTYYPRIHYSSGYMTVKQVEHYLDKSKRSEIAKAIVMGAISNMLSILKYYRRKGRRVDNSIEELKSYRNKVKNADSVDVLMGIEGNARKSYFNAWNEIIRNNDFYFDIRSRRPPKNRLNALISFGNSLLYTFILGEIYRTHLDPRIGFLHENNFRRFTLNLDMAEIFKPILTDRIILHLINKKIITKDDFSRQMKGIYLKERGRRKFVEEFEKILGKSIILNKRKYKYERVIRLELYKLEKHLMGEKHYIPYTQSI